MPKRNQVQLPPTASQAHELEPLLTIVDLGKILRLSKPKIYELINTRSLPSLKIDGARRFERAKVQAWIEQQRDVS